ncbi:MAG TPA: alpha/beta hydrolase [Lachnospiraceae bacterium]|nr:alpha/beta hydrolase [uncultured Lachnoclostridium sp.]HAU85963.1 alpha/beta hydrolase [Lachnospiraceae bacterium]
MNYWVEVEKNVSLYVEDLNPEGKETILFIHGWPLNHDAFEYQYNELPNRNVRCIGVDTRGFGKSSRPISGYDYDSLADDIHAVIESLNLNHIILAGHSMGGAIAIRYMSRYNQAHVKQLVLIGAAAPSLIRRKGFNFGTAKSSIDDLIEQASTNRPQMLSNFSNMCFFQFVTDALTNWFSFLGLQAAGYATILCAITFRDEVLFEDLPKITVPTLIIHGVHDRIASYSLALILKQSIRNATILPFEQSGHMPFYEEKQKFNQALLDFIKKPAQ